MRQPFSVFYIATITAASEMCLLIGRGALISMFSVLFVLPGFLILLNRVIKKTTLGWPGKENREKADGR